VPNRLRDPDKSFSKELTLVVCPRCSMSAMAQDGMVTCRYCGFSHNFQNPERPTELVHTTWQPRCNRCGGALPKIARRMWQGKARQIPIRCQACAHVDGYKVRSKPNPVLAGHDPISWLPYFLRVTIDGNTVWFQNFNHLKHIEAFVSAPLRIRAIAAPHMTSLERLPAWIKSARNRGPILRAIKRLRQMHLQREPK
jgi:hypothetical protein